MVPSNWQAHAPVAVVEWRAFLLHWSVAVGKLSADTGQAGEEAWFGFPGVREEDISAVEARLNIQLPPSYRAFLLVTNGWRTGSSLPSQLLPVEQVNLLVKQHSDWVNEWVVSADELGVLDDPEQPAMHLPYTLQVSDVEDNSVCLLNPRVVGAGGEFEAWFFGNWIPGADVYPSFGSLMVGRLESILYRQNK